MKDMILFPEDIDRLNVILDQLAKKANLLLSVLINKDGRLLTYQGSLERVDTVSMAALVAGNSASTLAIANLMGETEFSAMYHQGKERHIFITVVDENTFLCLVFDDRTNIDRVKVFARQFDRQIKKALIMVYDKSEDQVDLDLGLGFDTGTQGAAEQIGLQSPPPPNASFHQQDTMVSAHNPEPPAQQHPSAPPAEHNQIPIEQIQDNDDAVHIADLNVQSTGKMSGEVHDTNYLYLKKKIRETVKRKKE